MDWLFEIISFRNRILEKILINKDVVLDEVMFVIDDKQNFQVIMSHQEKLNDLMMEYWIKILY